MAVRKRRGSRKRLTYVAAAVVLLVVTVVVVRAVLYAPSSSTGVPRKAALVNQISEVWPNYELVNSVAEMFGEADIPLDIFNSSDVTVDFYRQLPSRGYGIVIFRVHAATLSADPDPQKPIFLFTSEPYDSQKYPTLQQTGQVFSVRTARGSPLYFGVSPSFIGHGTVGRFQGTLVLMMGCEGLLATNDVVNTQLGEAFVSMGASVFVSWDGFVTATHTDRATIRLLTSVVVERVDVARAVQQTNAAVGPDPDYRSVIRYYPFNLGGYVWTPREAVRLASAVFLRPSGSAPRRYWTHYSTV